jgi:hypothetical protein
MLSTPDERTVEPFFVSSKCTRTVLGGAGETKLWEFVKRGFLHPVYSGRKALFAYAEVKALAKRIEAGELAPAHKAFRNHPAAIANSIASRRRKAQVRAKTAPAAATAKRGNTPAGEPPDAPPDWSGSGRRP